MTPAATPAGTAPTSSEKPADEVAEMRSALADLQATVAALVERTTVAPTPTTVPGGTSDTAEASRIIVMANHTAEATLEDARNEAAGIVAAAKAQSTEIIRLARELADNELAAERERVARSTEAWLNHRADITDRLRTLESTLVGYQTGLGDVDTSIKGAIAELEADDTAAFIDRLPAPDPASLVIPSTGDGPVPLDAASTDAASTDAGSTEPASSTTIDLTDRHDDVLTPEVVSSGAAASVTPIGSSLPTFLGGPAPVATADASVEASGVDAVGVESALVEEEQAPASNLRPGLFGR